MVYEDWIKEIRLNEVFFDVVDETDERIWKEYFEEGVDPNEAFFEEFEDFIDGGSRQYNDD